MQIKPFIHEKTPAKLRTAFRRAKNRRGEGYKLDILAKNLGVNIYYLYKLIKNGIEPNDTTEKLQEVRAKMFLPRHKRKPHKERKPVLPMPNYLVWWRSLPKEDRAGIIAQAWKQLNGTKP